MKKLSGKYFMTNFALALIVLSGIVVFAAKNETVGRALSILRPEVKVRISGTVQRSSQNVSLEKVESVKSGEILDWNINSANSGNASAQNYRVVGQIAPETVFVAGSARSEGAAAMQYSIDGGKTFSAEPMIEERQADGSLKQVPAPVSMYSQIRFEWAKDLPADSQLNAAYKTRVK